jgi:queuine tRNA-ribosyltransferase
VQGGANPKLREGSARALVAIDFHGYAIGGLAVGEPQDVMLQMVEATAAHLPQDKPRYLMGVGEPDDLLHAVERGIAMFDCVLPTRAGRHALAYTRFGKINLKNALHAEDPAPLDAESDCPAARDYSRAYLHHLVKANEVLASMLLSWANIAYYQSLMADMREAIFAGRFKDFTAETRAGWAKSNAD